MKSAKMFTIFISLLVIVGLFSVVTPAIGSPPDTVRVWVSYQSGRKSEVARALTRANASLHYDFPELEAYVVTLPSAALDGILHNPFVVGVEGDPERRPIEPVKVELETKLDDHILFETEVIPWGIEAVQARQVWDTDDDGQMDEDVPTGEGIKVCIIDTGYYEGHEDLLGISDGVTGMSQVDDDWTSDGVGHGSHVAGTIAALNNGYGVVGVSPGMVDFHIVKIFGNDGAWVMRASDLTAAIYDCRDHGANVISMSMGGTSSNRKEERAFDELYNGGILHVAAAGNEQVETPNALSYPASYGSVISVAAVDQSLAVADFSLQNEAVELAAPGVGVLSTISYIETTKLIVGDTDYAANHIEFSAYGTASGTLVNGGLCDTNEDWTGNIVLCQRGGISFYDKVMAVQNGGGAAAIIYNNEPGNFFGTLGEGETSSIVGISISQENGDYLVENRLGTEATVESNFEWPASGYEAWGGTSMATPHVSGVAALVWSANTAWTNVEIREAMRETAIDLGGTGHDIIFGYGLVQAAEALDYLEDGTPPPPPTDELSIEILEPDQGTYFQDKQTVTISIRVTEDGQPVESAEVEVTVTGQLSKPKSFYGTTDSNGVVDFYYRINARRTGTGQYTIDATAVKDGYEAVSTSSNFTVH